MKDKELVVKKDGILNKILGFFKNIFSKSYDSEELNLNMEETTIIQNAPKQEETNILATLLDIQKKLSKNGINEENLNVLIKDLSFEQREQLKNLYKEQNSSLKSEIELYNRKIKAIKV